MIGVDADLLPPQVEGVGAVVDGLELVVRLEVRKPPEPAVDDVRKAFLLRDLKTKQNEFMNQSLKIEETRKCILIFDLSQ